MIPAFVEEDAPPGERMVFDWLSVAPDDWTVMHALDLAPWNSLRRTEIDFVVVIPNTGLICLEVKSHRRIEFRDGQWYPRTIRKSPFKQAADAAHALYRRLKGRLLGRCFPRVPPVVHGCVFTEAEFPLNDCLGVSPWELIDAARLRELDLPKDFWKEIQRMARQAIAEDPRVVPLERKMADAWIECIVEHCYPVRLRHPEAREEIDRRRKELDDALRVQQRPVIGLVEWNKRVLVEGAAGTGKTLIAMELARREAERGRRTALLCFNRAIAEWITGRMAAMTPPLPTLVVGTVDSILMRIADIEAPSVASERFWEEELPQLLEERFTDPEILFDGQFDALVVDEAQDVLARRWRMDLLGIILKGGWRDGRFVLFGDFEHQVLGDVRTMRASLGELLLDARPAVWRLGENCRNYQQVGEYAALLGGFGKNVYAGVLRGRGGAGRGDIVCWKDKEEQAQQIIGEIASFKEKGYGEDSMVLITPFKEERSVVPFLKADGVEMRPWSERGSGLAYTTVQAFKGLEAEVVFAADLDVQDTPFWRDLLYTATTRATEAIRLFVNRGSMPYLAKWVQEA